MRRWNIQPTASRGTTDVNMTPLIDVSLVLVVILLLATPLAFESSFAVRRAMASARSADTATSHERIEVTILSADSVRVNRMVVGKDVLRTTLEPLVARSATGIVSVSCPDTVRHGTFVTVLDAIKLSGARDIAVAGS